MPVTPNKIKTFFIEQNYAEYFLNFLTASKTEEFRPVTLIFDWLTVNRLVMDCFFVYFSRLDPV